MTRGEKELELLFQELLENLQQKEGCKCIVCNKNVPEDKVYELARLIEINICASYCNECYPSSKVGYE